MIGEMNRRVIVTSWGSIQDAGGGLSPVQIGAYPLWAKVRARNGSLYTGEQQALWNYDYEITTRYEKSRIVKSNQTYEYDGKRLAINSVSFSEEGNRKYVVCRCSTTDAAVDVSQDIRLTIKTFDYYGVGGEDIFSDPVLVGRTIIGAFKDGIEFAVLLSGVPDIEQRQVLYSPAAGSFLWSIPFEPGEHSLIQYVALCE